MQTIQWINGVNDKAALGIRVATRDTIGVQIIITQIRQHNGLRAQMVVAVTATTIIMVKFINHKGINHNSRQIHTVILHQPMVPVVIRLVTVLILLIIQTVFQTIQQL